MKDTGDRTQKSKRARLSKVPDLNIIVLSDLHLSGGWKEKLHRYSSREDFLFDEPFSRFLRYLEQVSEENRRKWRLVIAGDLIDFLQVTEKPCKQQRRQVGFELSASEERFGLGTDPDKTVWKLDRVVAGHEVFFRALGEFAASGNKVTIVKGNHDIEFHWLAVRQRFVENTQRVFDELSPSASDADREAIRQNIEFVPWFYYEPGLIYVEHGNQYEPFNSFDDFLNPVLPASPQEPQSRLIDLPLGSFFVRYFFNDIEAFAPFADNIKPPLKYIPQLLIRHPFKLLTVFRTFWAYRFLVFQTLRKTFQKHRLKMHSSRATKPGNNWEIGWSNRGGLSGDKLKRIADLKATSIMHNPLTYIKGSLLRPRRPQEDVLREKSRAIRQILPDTKYVVFGHTHKADVYPIPGGNECWYFNVGTWTPIFSQEERQLRDVVEFIFLQLEEKDGETRAELMRWNDGAGEADRLRLLEEPPTQEDVRWQRANTESHYRDLTGELRRVDIVLVRHKREWLLSPIIRFATRSYWNHVALVYVIPHSDEGYDNTFIIDSGRGGVDVHNIRRYLDSPRQYDIGIKRVKAEWFSGEEGLEIRRRIRGLLLNEIDAHFDVSTLVRIGRRTLGSLIFGSVQLWTVMRTRRRKEPTEIRPGKLTPDRYICGGLAQYTYVQGVLYELRKEDDAAKKKKLEDVVFKPDFRIGQDNEEALLSTTPADFANCDKLAWKFIVKDGAVVRDPKCIDAVLRYWG